MSPNGTEKPVADSVFYDIRMPKRTEALRADNTPDVQPRYRAGNSFLFAAHYAARSDCAVYTNCCLTTSCSTLETG